MTALRRATLGLATGLLLVSGLSALGATPASATPTPTGTAALTWLAKDLAASDHLFEQAGQPDFGLTMDAILALDLGGQGATDAAAALAKLEAHIGEYVTGQAFGAPDDRYAGPLGKSLLTAAVAGTDVHDFGGYDLEALVRARLQTAGPQAGRFSDLSPVSGDNSNGFDEALSILGLSRTTAGVPAAAVTFLLAQQCPAGGFRGAYGTAAACTADADADTDYTAIAMDALLTVPTSPGATGALQRAAAWFIGRQTPAGGFTNAFGDVNSNTAGLAGQALRGAGQAAAADKATAFVESLQLTAARVGNGPGAADAGAVAFAEGARDDAITNGIDPLVRDQFRRATAQAALALGLAPYGNIPTGSGATTTTTTVAGAVGATTTTAPGTPTTTSAGSGATTAAAAGTGAAAGATRSIPATGTDAQQLVLIALALIGAGEIARRAAAQARRAGT